MYERLKVLYYQRRLTELRLEIAVSKGWITEKEKNDIIAGGQIELE